MELSTLAKPTKYTNHIVKRGGHTQPYDRNKLYASIYTSALSVHESVGVAELLAETVVQTFETWLGNRHEITSVDIRRVATEALAQHNEDAAYMYRHHRNIS